MSKHVVPFGKGTRTTSREPGRLAGSHHEHEIAPGGHAIRQGQRLGAVGAHVLVGDQHATGAEQRRKAVGQERRERIAQPGAAVPVRDRGRGAGQGAAAAAVDAGFVMVCSSRLRYGLDGSPARGRMRGLVSVDSLPGSPPGES